MSNENKHHVIDFLHHFTQTMTGDSHDLSEEDTYCHPKNRIINFWQVPINFEFIYRLDHDPDCTFSFAPTDFSLIYMFPIALNPIIYAPMVLK